VHIQLLGFIQFFLAFYYAFYGYYGPVVVEERMMPGQWLGSVLSVHFGTSTTMVGLQEGHLSL